MFGKTNLTNCTSEIIRISSVFLFLSKATIANELMPGNKMKESLSYEASSKQNIYLKSQFG